MSNAVYDIMESVIEFNVKRRERNTLILACTNWQAILALCILKLDLLILAMELDEWVKLIKRNIQQF